MGMKRTGKGLSHKWKEPHVIVSQQQGGISSKREMTWEEKKRLRDAQHNNQGSDIRIVREGEWWRVKADLFYAGMEMFSAGTEAFKEEEVREVYPLTKQAAHILQGSAQPAHMLVQYQLPDGEHKMYVQISRGRKVELPLGVTGGRVRTCNPSRILCFNDWARYSGNPHRSG
jgi:hypothetical protein